MPTKDARIPNKPLSGSELKEVVLKHADELLAAAHENAMFALRKKLDADSILGPGYAFMRPKFRMKLDFIWLTIPRVISVSLMSKGRARFASAFLLSRWLF